MRSALVLAGGRGRPTRDASGRVAEVDGEPAVRRVVRRVGKTVDEVVVTCRDAQRDRIAEALDGLDYRFAVDRTARGEPVGRMRTGFRMVSGSAVAVVACGLPRVDPALLEGLFDACDGAAVPRADDRLYPLHAVYDRRNARAACDRTLAVGSRRLYDVLSRVDPVTVPVGAVDGVADDPFATDDRIEDLTTATGAITG
ncbi:NTP transferase domain-containing protein [Halomicrobium salinisoli]|uniref:NTP transferase domain-containing protein n=1 Tax=Halomicrobium salinisoli TaxID=2878391 RepID=UPI001CEFBA27|nr:NTP transferase domain-containing protein [Halomicrobium salinisoli]